MTYCAALVLLSLIGATGPANSPSKIHKRASNRLCPDERVYTGNYRNLRFGFSIVIPAGLKGYWNSVQCVHDERLGCLCLGDHGRFIPLSHYASIEAYAGYQTKTDGTVIDFENDEISSLKGEKSLNQVTVAASRWIRIGGLRARQFRVTYIKKDRRFVTDQVIALHLGVEYQLILRTLADRYKRCRTQFERVIASWRLTRRTDQVRRSA